jgi:restriction endonuclease S subunit
MELNSIAHCNVDSGNIMILTDDDFNNVFFKKDSYLAQSVMYHELGHCLLKLKHKDNSFNVMNGEVQYSNKKFSGSDFNKYLYQLSYGMDKYDESLSGLTVTDSELDLMKNDSKLKTNVFSAMKDFWILVLSMFQMVDFYMIEL